MEKFISHCTREDRNNCAKTKPFGLCWKIGNLGHWTREGHGDSVATSVDFDGTRVEFKVYPQCADDGRMEVHFPEELSRYSGRLTIKISGGRVQLEARKERGQRIVCCGPQMDRFRRYLTSEAWERGLVFIFLLENVGVTARCEYTSTMLQPVPHTAASLRSQADVLRGNTAASPQWAPPNDDAGLCRAEGLSWGSHVVCNHPTQTSSPGRQKIKKLLAERREHILANRQARYLANRLVPSLASLSLGKAVEEPNQLSKNDERVSLTSECNARLFSQPGKAIVRRRSRLVSFPLRQPVPPNANLEQLVPGLGSSSVSREVEKSPSSSDRPEDAAIASLQCENVVFLRPVPVSETGKNYRTERPNSYVCQYLLKAALDERATLLPVLGTSNDDDINSGRPIHSRYLPY